MAGAGIKAQAMGAKIPDDWVEALYAKMFATLARSVPVIPGIEAVLDRLDSHGILHPLNAYARLPPLAGLAALSIVCESEACASLYPKNIHSCVSNSPCLFNAFATAR